MVTLERISRTTVTGCHCLLKSGTTCSCSQLVLKANPLITAHGSQVRQKWEADCPIFLKHKVFVELSILDGEQKVLLCNLIVDLLLN